MPSTITKLLDKISTKEKVELTEKEKAEYFIFRPKEEPKEEKKSFNWEDTKAQETPSWIKQDKKENVKIPFAPTEGNKPKEKSEKLPEDTIRSEVQYMIDNYRRVIDKFPTFTTLTLAEAKAIAEKVK
jgi:hypothetical protein